MLENLSGKDFKSQLKENKMLRTVTMAVSAIVLVTVGYFAYKTFIWNPANEKSKDAYWTGLNYAAKDSTNQAIEELSSVVKKYDGKQGGENAQFVLARQYMTKRDFKKALEHLEGVDVNDTYVAVYTLGLQGDCYSEMKKYTEAKDFYLKAADKNENEKTSPEYIFKAALCAEKLGDISGAEELYTRIKDNYVMFSNMKSIDKYIARVKNKAK
jgi:TolA-binding protein